MDPYAVSHFSNQALLQDLKALVAQDRATTAVLLTRIAEVDERKLYLAEGYSSMFTYCVRELRMSEDSAGKRIHAARTARRFPAIFVVLAQGQLHLTAVQMLAPHLTSGNADDLLAAATHKTKVELELLLARRFPRPDLPERLQSVPPPPMPNLPSGRPSPGPADQHALEHVWATIPDPQAHVVASPPGSPHEHAPERVETSVLAPARVAPTHALEHVESPTPRARMMPLAPQRFGLQVTLDRETHDLLQYARALMGHQNPTGEIAPVLKSALRLLVGHLEKQKFAATSCPRPGSRRPAGSDVGGLARAARHIPAAVKREVWERDQGQCTFASDTGKRCQERGMLEFDHEVPVAHGGVATMDNVRLRCRAHNQHAAEQLFGVDFMNHKRREARERGVVHARR